MLDAAVFAVSTRIHQPDLFTLATLVLVTVVVVVVFCAFAAEGPTPRKMASRVIAITEPNQCRVLLWVVFVLVCDFKGG
jgi:hypothetical protein